MELKNGTLYSGIFHTFKEEGGIVLRMAYSESNHSQTSKIPYILIMDADIVRITAKNVSFASETQNNSNLCAKSF